MKKEESQPYFNSTPIIITFKRQAPESRVSHDVTLVIELKIKKNNAIIIIIISRRRSQSVINGIDLKLSRQNTYIFIFINESLKKRNKILFIEEKREHQCLSPRAKTIKTIFFNLKDVPLYYFFV